MKLTARRALSVGALALIASTGWLAATKNDDLSHEEVIKRWADGPVRYLMSHQEETELRKLKTTPELGQYITSFWARRDPSPGTLENEFRRIYWARVLEANKRFRDSTVPGWKTDRGKIYVLLGEPFEVERDEAPQVPQAPSSSRAPDRDAGVRGIERWIYRRQYSVTTDPEYIVSFVRDVSLDWKLTSNPDLLTPDFPGVNTLNTTDTQFGGIENRSRIIQNRGAAAAGSSNKLSLMGQDRGEGAPPEFNTSAFANYDLGLELSVPSNTEAVLAVVNAREFLSGFNASTKFEFFRAQDGSTFVNVGALMRASELYGESATGESRLRLYASLAPASDLAHPHFASNEANPVVFDAAKGPEPGGLVDVWTGLAVPPGHYQATIGVEDTLTGRLGRGSAEIDVPDLSGSRLSLSSLVLASSLSESGERLGVKARSSAVFRKSEDFAVYYEVYGLPTENRGVKFDVAYRFYRETPKGTQAIGKQIASAERTEAVQGWSFPLEKWPTGRFRLEVTVTAPSGSTVSAQVPFEVTE